MTERERERPITLADYDPQSLEVARQLGTEPLLTGIDHSVYDDYVRNSLLHDFVIYFDGKSDVNNVTRGSDKPCSFDCSTRAMIDDGCRVPPRTVLQADTIIVSCGLKNSERTFWSTQRTHEFGRLHDELATAADYDKFDESSEENYPGVCDGRSIWMIDCRKLDGSDQDKNMATQVSPNSRIMKSILGSKDYHE